MKDKKAIEMGFNWIFAIIAGITILLIALYAASQFITTGSKVSYSENAAKLVGFLDPLETRLSSGKKPVEIHFRNELEIEFSCDEQSNRPFGRQGLRLGAGDEFGSEIPIKDKYIFFENSEVKALYIFAKPFSLSYKVGDLIMMSSENYCFVDSPEDVEDEIVDLGLKNIKLVESVDECEDKSIKVCFDGSSCDVIVDGDYKSGVVSKDYEELHYMENLLFAAIFSDADIYECNVKRLINRFKEIAKIYKEKIKIINDKGCISNIEGKLDLMIGAEFESSQDLLSWEKMVKDIDNMNKNQERGCGVW